jgi:hypothetical protein
MVGFWYDFFAVLTCQFGGARAIAVDYPLYRFSFTP